MNHYFFAMLHRMRYIRRWSLMRNTEAENIREHSLEVAYLVHALALIRREYFPDSPPCLSPEDCVMLALYHDVSEIITGDLPTPVKYFNAELRSAFGQLEEEARLIMLRGIPGELRESYRPFLSPSPTCPEEEEALRLVKAADTLSAYIKCLDERSAGNGEFADAEKSILDKLKSYNIHELDYFIDNMLPSYSLTLDQLKRGGEPED